MRSIKALTKSQTKSILEMGGKNNTPAITINNFYLIMTNDAQYEAIRFNELRGMPEIHMNGSVRLWNDADEAESMRYIEENYKLYSKDKHMAALRMLFAERKYNPIIDLIDSVKWDGEERCASYLTKWAMVDDNEYTREVSRLIFAGGIHRLYLPGCKFEDVPILMVIDPVTVVSIALTLHWIPPSVASEVNQRRATVAGRGEDASARQLGRVTVVRFAIMVALA